MQFIFLDIEIKNKLYHNYICYNCELINYNIKRPGKNLKVSS